MRYRTLPRTDVTVSEVGFGVWTLATGWWGEYTDERRRRPARAAPTSSASRSSTRPTPTATGRGETLLRRGVRRPSRRGRHRDEVRLRHLLAPGPQAASASAPTTGRPTFVRYALRAQPGAPRHATASTSTSCTTRAWTRMRVGRAVRDARRPRARGQDPRLRRLARAGDRLARRGRCAALSQPPDLGPCRSSTTSLEQDPGREFLPTCARERGGTRLIVRVPHSSGMLEGKYTTETTFPPRTTTAATARASGWSRACRRSRRLDFLTDDRRAHARAGRARSGCWPTRSS